MKDRRFENNISVVVTSVAFRMRDGSSVWSTEKLRFPKLADGWSHGYLNGRHSFLSVHRG